VMIPKVLLKLLGIGRDTGRLDDQHDEAEVENLMRDHDVAMSRVAASTSLIQSSQEKLRESIRSVRDHDRDTSRTMLERTRWRR
jgi:hypothetical protein